MELADLDLGYLAQFVGMRVNELVLDRAAADGHGDLRSAHGYVFQHLIDGPRTIGDLARRLGVSQQAASKSVNELLRLRYLKATVKADDKRARSIELSPRGRDAIAHTRRFRARLERKLVTKHGASIDQARALLVEVLADLGGSEAVRTRRIREPR